LQNQQIFADVRIFRQNLICKIYIQCNSKNWLIVGRSESKWLGVECSF